MPPLISITELELASRGGDGLRRLSLILKETTDKHVIRVLNAYPRYDAQKAERHALIGLVKAIAIYLKNAEVNLEKKIYFEDYYGWWVRNEIIMDAEREE